MNKLTQRFLSALKFYPTSGKIISQENQEKSTLKKIISLGIIATSLGLTYYPLIIATKTITIVTGSELQEPLQLIEKKFEQANPRLELEIKIQGSQDIISNFINQKNDFETTILMPANDQLIIELKEQLKTEQNQDIFYNQPEAIAKTVLVAIAWEERGKILFPDGKFNWSKLENALQVRDWDQLGGNKQWGSFDFLMTDPLRSNSSQLALNLWVQNKLATNNLTINNINNNQTKSLFQLIKNRVYQPPRSTDILLQEFIVRGRNDVDVAISYESIALYRWLQVQDSKKYNYQIYYPNPSIETTITAVIPRQNVSKSEAKQAQKFIDFLRQEEQQIIFAQYGFRPIINLDLNSLSNTPWSKNIPGVEVNLPHELQSSPNSEIMDTIQNIWQQKGR